MRRYTDRGRGVGTVFQVSSRKTSIRNKCPFATRINCHCTTDESYRPPASSTQLHWRLLPFHILFSDPDLKTGWSEVRFNTREDMRANLPR